MEENKCEIRRNEEKPLNTNLKIKQKQRKPCKIAPNYQITFGFQLREELSPSQKNLAGANLKLEVFSQFKKIIFMEIIVFRITNLEYWVF